MVFTVFFMQFYEFCVAMLSVKEVLTLYREKQTVSDKKNATSFKRLLILIITKKNG